VIASALAYSAAHSALLPLVTMAIWGGDVLKQFAVPMIAGTIVGTYSSIYVVSSLVVSWKAAKEPKKSK